MHGILFRDPRLKSPAQFIKISKHSPSGLSAADLTKDQQAKLLETMRRMLVCFRPDDVAATMKTIEDKNLVQRLFISCHSGKYDIASGKVWDTSQIESPDFVWYFRPPPHTSTAISIFLFNSLLKPSYQDCDA